MIRDNSALPHDFQQFFTKVSRVPTSIHMNAFLFPFYIRQKIGNCLYIQKVDLNEIKPIRLVRGFSIDYFPPNVNSLIMDDKDANYLFICYYNRELFQIRVHWSDGFVVSDESFKSKYIIRNFKNGRKVWEKYKGNSEPHLAFKSIVNIFEQVFHQKCEECLLDQNSRLIKEFIELLHDDPDDSEILELYNGDKLNKIAQHLKEIGARHFLWDFFKKIHGHRFCDNLKNKNIYIEDKDISIRTEKRYFLESIKNDFYSKIICTTSKFFYESLDLVIYQGQKTNVYEREDVLKKYFEINESEDQCKN